jgi:hypothetical protein
MTHRILLSALCGLCSNDNLPILLLSGENFGAQLELETLLGQRFLELFSKYPVNVKTQGKAQS